MLALVACTADSDYTVAVDFEPDALGERVERVVVEVMDRCPTDGIEGSVRARSIVTRAGMGTIQIPLDTGTQAISVVAVGAACGVIGHGCTELDVRAGESQRVDVVVRATSRGACSLSRCGCEGGVDAGVDAPSVDAPSMDAPGEDAPGEDAPGEDAPADVGPDVPACSVDYGALIRGQSPVAYYRFDDAAGSPTAVDDMGVHDGTYRGTAPAPVLAGEGAIAGDESTSVYFGYGSDNTAAALRLPDTLDATMTMSPLSITQWVRVHDVHPPSFGNTLIISERFDVYGFRFGYRDDGTLLLSANNSGGTTRLTTDPVLLDGEWHHVGMRLLPPTRAEIYVDGVLANSTDTADFVRTGDGDLDTGLGYLHAIVCDADIDELAIYDRALTPEEIRAQFDLGHTCD